MKLHGLGLRPDGHAALGFVTAAKAAVQYEGAAATAGSRGGVRQFRFPLRPLQTADPAGAVPGPGE